MALHGTISHQLMTHMADRGHGCRADDASVTPQRLIPEASCVAVALFAIREGLPALLHSMGELRFNQYRADAAAAAAVADAGGLQG